MRTCPLLLVLALAACGSESGKAPAQSGPRQLYDETVTVEGKKSLTMEFAPRIEGTLTLVVVPQGGR